MTLIQNFKHLIPTGEIIQEETTHYNYGLEEIYALEKVDIKTIRPMTPIEVEPQVEVRDGAINQLEFGFQELSYPYVDNKEGSISFDCIKWVKALVEKCESKKAKVLLERFSLGHLIMLIPSDDLQVRQLSPALRRSWCAEVVHILRTQQPIGDFIDALHEALIKPWMFQRFGVAKQVELIELLERCAVQPELIQPVLQFLGMVYFQGEFPLVRNLSYVEEGLLCLDSSFAESYQNIVERAFTYFYQTSSCYELPQLVSLIERESAKVWEGFSEGFVEKVLRYSPHFRVRKDLSQKLIVRLA